LRGIWDAPGLSRLKPVLAMASVNKYRPKPAQTVPRSAASAPRTTVKKLPCN
jgi:hypothetical protein